MHQAFPRTRLTPPHSIIHAVASSVPSNYFQSRGAGPGSKINLIPVQVYVSEAFSSLSLSLCLPSSLIQLWRRVAYTTRETWQREWREAYENERGTRWTHTYTRRGGCKELDKVTMSARKGLSWVMAYLGTSIQVSHQTGAILQMDRGTLLSRPNRDSLQACPKALSLRGGANR